jgi:hypothetical protein
MTKFEKRIHAHVVERVPEMIEDLKKLKYLDQSLQIQYPFVFESVVDWVTFDTNTLEPLFIEYKWGVGPGVSDGLTTSFDEYEVRRLAVVMPKEKSFEDLCNEIKGFREAITQNERVNFVYQHDEQCIGFENELHHHERDMLKFKLIWKRPTTTPIDNEQIESASWEFVADKVNQPNGWIRTAFVAGAQWAIEQSKQTK